MQFLICAAGIKINIMIVAGSAHFKREINNIILDTMVTIMEICYWVLDTPGRDQPTEYTFDVSSVLLLWWVKRDSLDFSFDIWEPVGLLLS